MLCAKCQLIDFGEVNTNLEQYEYAHHTLSAMIDSADHGCHLCAMIFHHLCFDQNDDTSPDDQTWLDEHRSGTRPVVLYLESRDGKLEPNACQVLAALQGDRLSYLYGPRRRTAYFSISALNGVGSCIA